MDVERKQDKDKIIQIPGLDYIPDSRGLGYVFFDCMSRYKERTAQIDALTGEKDTYESLLQRCIRTALAMRTKGITPDDIVIICTFNHLNSCVPFISTLFIGAKVASLDPTLSLEDTVHLLKQVSPKIIFVASEATELIEEAVKRISGNIEIVVFGRTDIHIPFLDFLQITAEEENFQPYKVKNLRETAIILFSSGTTGLPKGICINHFHLLGQLTNIIGFGYCRDITLSFTSLYWITAVIYMSTAVLTGLTRLVVPKFDAENMHNVIDKFKPTFISAPPNQLFVIAKKGRVSGKDFSSVKHIVTGGTPMLEKQILTIREAFPNSILFNVYGQTEVLTVLVFKASKPEEYEFIKKKPTSSGTGVPGYTYKVVDPDTEEILGPNQQGELRLKSELITNGYYNRDSSEIWDADGWYKTGDLVYYDEDRCFYVVDRLKEVLKFQNWHVPPAVLEHILATHPAVLTSVVIGIPHEDDGDLPKALVVLKEAYKSVTPEEIKKYVEERVDDKKKLRGGVKIVNIIPMTNTGKIRRREIRDMVLRGEI